MPDSVQDDAYKIIFRDERPAVIEWVKNRPELHTRHSVYLEKEAKYVSIREYLDWYDPSKILNLSATGKVDVVGLSYDSANDRWVEHR